MKIVSSSPKETRSVALKILETLQGADEIAPAVLALQGDLGAGKTTFVQGLAQALGVSTHILSPTFVLEKRYALSPTEVNRRFATLIHIDAYRITANDAGINWKEILSDTHNLVVIEWSENVAEHIPDNALTLSFEHNSESVRIITLKNGNN